MDSKRPKYATLPNIKFAPNNQPPRQIGVDVEHVFRSKTVEELTPAELVTLSKITQLWAQNPSPSKSGTISPSKASATSAAKAKTPTATPAQSKNPSNSHSQG